MNYLIIFVSQLVFSFARTLNTRYVSRDMIFMSVLTGVFVKVSWLISTFLGIKSLFDQNYYLTLFYIAGGIIGDYASFKIKLIK